MKALADNETMSAFEVIEQIKELPPREREQVARFIVENTGATQPRRFSVGTAGDGLPVIHVDDGIITSQLVHELESRTP